tara:strand:- start:3779 stop:4780 length:1002 start_codon:yes stop_codon:yes gene_type:complete
VIIKSYIAEQNYSALDNYKSILFYGENDGIKDDFKEFVREKNKGSEIINFFQEELIKNDKVLLEEVNNSSLFSTKKIIFINSVTDKIFALITDCLSKESKELKFYIFSEILDRKSKIRSYFEKDKQKGIIACYQDDERKLSNYIKIKLKEFKGVTPEIVNLIISNSNLDRRIIKNEVLKIKLCFTEKKISMDGLEELLNIKSDDNFNKIRDACLLGENKKVNKLLGELDFKNESFVFHLYSLNSRILKLSEILNTLENIKDIDVALENLKPKIFWKDKPIYIQQLKKWNQKKLQAILSKISETELLIKKHSQIKADTVIKNLLIDICVRASSV